MSAKKLGTFILVGIDILATEISAKTKALLAQTGSASTEDVETNAVEFWQHCGFASRPSTPSSGAEGGACQGVIIRQSHFDACIATRDARGRDLQGSLQPGETCVYAPGADGDSQGRMLLKDNGGVSMISTFGNVVGGDTAIVQIEGDTTHISLANKFGGISITEDGITIMFGNSSGIQLDANGISLIGQAIGLNGAAVSLGANAIMPVVWGPAGLSGVGSTSVKVAI